MVDIDALAALLEKETKGPLNAILRFETKDKTASVKDNRGIRIASFDWERDALLYATAVNALPALLAEVRELRERCDTAERDAANERALAINAFAHIQDGGDPALVGHPG